MNRSKANLRVISVFCIIIVCVFSNISAQNKIEVETIKNGNLTQEEYFSNLKAWSSSTINGYRWAVDSEDKESREMVIEVKAEIPLNLVCIEAKQMKPIIRFKVKIDCRDNKYRATITSLIYQSEMVNLVPMGDLSTSILYKVRDELKLIVDLSTIYFGSSVEWVIGDPYYSAIESLKLKKEDYLNEKGALNIEIKKERKKIETIEYSIEKMDKKIELLSNIVSGGDKVIKEFLSYLDKSISVKDDF